MNRIKEYNMLTGAILFAGLLLMMWVFSAPLSLGLENNSNFNNFLAANIH